ncbi:hypothetical protein M433DRAFT_149475 [Acidomyces richmondensis BFW]|nr:MAG: hypothetical protein FE78DRAFT_90760 [Acidomyces sp. 'richmondensis']KYG49919.1 hypothetical protein M433DRAFT_149475 [Acidomyces richmondensis BFW]
MQFQLLFALSGVALTGNVAFASMLEHGDVPNQCRNACEPIVDICESCERGHSDDELAEHQCICNWGPAKTQVPLCAACIDQNNRKSVKNDGNGNDEDDDNNDADDDDNGDGNRSNSTSKLSTSDLSLTLSIYRCS